MVRPGIPAIPGIFLKMVRVFILKMVRVRVFFSELCNSTKKDLFEQFYAYFAGKKGWVGRNQPEQKAQLELLSFHMSHHL